MPPESESPSETPAAVLPPSPPPVAPIARPIAIMVVCGFFLVGALLNLKLAIFGPASGTSSWYSPWLVINSAVLGVLLVGIWNLRRWAFYSYGVWCVVVEVAMFAMLGGWQPQTTLVRGLWLLILFKYLKNTNSRPVLGSLADLVLRNNKTFIGIGLAGLVCVLAGGHYYFVTSRLSLQIGGAQGDHGLNAQARGAFTTLCVGVALLLALGLVAFLGQRRKNSLLPPSERDGETRPPST